MAATDATDDPSGVGHALAAFIREQMEERRWRQRDVVVASRGVLSRQQVSTYANDHRDRMTRLPERATLQGFSNAFNVPVEFLLAKAVEALDLGYSSGDFINDVTVASDDQLLDEVRRRLHEVGVSSDELVADEPQESDLDTLVTGHIEQGYAKASKEHEKTTRRSHPA